MGGPAMGGRAMGGPAMGAPVTRVILVRHGLTAWNLGHRFQGHQDVPLSDLGRRQAQRIAVRLQHERLTSAFASDLARTRETAEAVTSQQEIQLNVTPELREMSFGAWEGLTSKQIERKYPTEWSAWIEDPVHTSPPDGESLEHLAGRAVAFFESTLKDETPGEASDRRRRRSTFLFVCHGGTLRALLTHLLDIPLDRYWRFAVRPGSISILDLYPEGAIAAVIGETSHLEGLR